MRLLAIPILLVTLVVALGACGGSSDDKFGGSERSGATGASGQSGSTSGAALSKPVTKKRQSARGSQQGRGRQAGRGARKGKGSGGRNRGRARRGARPSTYAIAKKVCGQFLLDTFVKSHNKVKTARKYSRAWPRRDRRAAYKGCLVGLRQSRPRSAGG